MKHILAVLFAVLAPCAHGQVLLSQVVDQVVPDGDTSGLLSSVTVSGVSGVIPRLTVTLELAGSGTEGGFNGDLYAYLRHGDGFAVLLNRPGRRADSPAGYGDGGMSVTFDDTASGDIHEYRRVLGGDHGVALTGALTGTWQVDGRQVDPISTVDFEGVARLADLASFGGMDPNGIWDLHVFDLSAGGETELRSWSVSMTAVPEPEDSVVCMALVLAAFGLWRRSGGRRVVDRGV